MSLFAPKAATILLKRQSLEFNGHQLQFSPEAVANSDVLNVDKLAEQISKFIKDIKLSKSSANLLLSPEIVFEKKFPAGPDSRAQIDQFYGEVPFDPKILAKKEINAGNEILALATNKRLLDAVVSGFGKAGIKIDLAAPESQQGENLKKSNFLDSKLAPTTSPQKSSKIMLIILPLIFALLLAGAIFAFLKLKPETPAPTKSPKTAAPSKTNTPTPAPTAAPTVDYSVQILNGTGTPGEAAQVQAVLEPLGLKDFTLGNAEEGSAAAQVSYSATVSAELQNKVNAELKKLFPSLKSSEASGSPAFAIQITTGT